MSCEAVSLIHRCQRRRRLRNDEADAESVRIELRDQRTTAAARFVGTLTIGSANFTYYIVGSEAFYVVETDMGSVLVGASYGQGTGTFSAASISSTNAMDEPFNGQSVNGPVVLAGQFTSDGMSTFTGVADYNDAGTVSPAPPDTLTTIYAIATTGYGSMTATVLNDSDFVTYGIYATDPALNINDPNNSSGGGGAVIAPDTASAVVWV